MTPEDILALPPNVLTQEQRARYFEDGYVVVENAVSDEWLERLRGAVSVGFGQVLDETGPWILVGLAVAAALEPAFDAAWISQLPPGLEVALFAVLGMPVYVCASGATPLVAVLVAQGVSPGAGIAFLIAGPATNVTTFGVLKSLHGTRVALSFGLGILGLCVGLGWGADLILDGVFVAPLALGHEGGSSAFTWACAALLALAFAVSVVRQGPRGFVGQVVKQASGENHSHEQGPVGCNQDKAGQGAEPDGCCS